MILMWFDANRSCARLAQVAMSFPVVKPMLFNQDRSKNTHKAASCMGKCFIELDYNLIIINSNFT